MTNYLMFLSQENVSADYHVPISMIPTEWRSAHVFSSLTAVRKGTSVIYLTTLLRIVYLHVFISYGATVRTQTVDMRISESILQHKSAKHSPQRGIVKKAVTARSGMCTNALSSMRRECAQIKNANFHTLRGLGGGEWQLRPRQHPSRLSLL